MKLLFLQLKFDNQHTLIVHVNSAQLCFNTVKYYSNIFKKRFLWLTFLQLENITKVLIKVLGKLFSTIRIKIH